MNTYPSKYAAKKQAKRCIARLLHPAEFEVLATDNEREFYFHVWSDYASDRLWLTEKGIANGAPMEDDEEDAG